MVVINKDMNDIVSIVSRDSIENDIILKQIDTKLDDLVQTRIFEIFLITTLSKKIHPVSLESIRMGSNPSYMKYIRDNRDTVERAKNKTRLSYCVKIFQHRLIKKSLRQFQVIIELHLGFVPDKNFCIEALRTHLV